MLTDAARVAAAVLATKITHGRVASPFTAREVYRNEWTGLTEPRGVQGALEGLAELGWIRAEAVRARDGPPCGSAPPGAQGRSLGPYRGSFVPHEREPVRAVRRVPHEGRHVMDRPEETADDQAVFLAVVDDDDGQGHGRGSRP